MDCFESFCIPYITKLIKAQKNKMAGELKKLKKMLCTHFQTST